MDDVNLQRVEADRRFNTYGVPRNKTDAKKKDKGAVTVPNANYLWINLFATSLKATGRAALVMANSASDARHSEADIRRTLIEKNLIYAMITLPSNMFYTVTLPATLWFFDKGKEDDKILFIDARNIFTQIDRAHREFTEEQIQDIAIISRLLKGDRQSFTTLVHQYFLEGFQRLEVNRDCLLNVSKSVIGFLKSCNGDDIPDFSKVLKGADSLETAFQRYQKGTDPTSVDSANERQRALNETVHPFFASLHELLKDVDKRVRHLEKDQKQNKQLKGIKIDLEALHKKVKDTEYFFQHIAWLQERFPDAKYEDVTGLCKLANLVEVEEQEYSLNPGRYVGVVIEEDGKTEEEFIEELLIMNAELEKLNSEARELEVVIGHNIRQIAGDE